jgi:hypothetical protein
MKGKELFNKIEKKTKKVDKTITKGLSSFGKPSKVKKKFNDNGLKF